MLLWKNLKGGQRMPYVLKSIAQHAGVIVPKGLVELVGETRIEMRQIDFGALNAIALRAVCDTMETFYLEVGRLPTAPDVQIADPRGR